jgi:hypothetical protein
MLVVHFKTEWRFETGQGADRRYFGAKFINRPLVRAARRALLDTGMPTAKLTSKYYFRVLHEANEISLGETLRHNGKPGVIGHRIYSDISLRQASVDVGWSDPISEAGLMLLRFELETPVDGMFSKQVPRSLPEEFKGKFDTIHMALGFASVGARVGSRLENEQVIRTLPFTYVQDLSRLPIEG